MLFGSAGGIVFALCVAASCFGALNASTFTAARLIYVAGREHYLPAMFGELHTKRLTPVKALVLQGVLTSVMVIVGDFSGLLMFIGVVGWSWYFVNSLWNIFDHRLRY
jgi:amino acid transporter